MSHLTIEHVAFHLWMLVGVVLLVLGEPAIAGVAFLVPLILPLVLAAGLKRVFRERGEA